MNLYTTLNKVVNCYRYAECRCNTQLKKIQHESEIADEEINRIMKEKIFLFEKLRDNEDELIGGRFLRNRLFEVLQHRAIIQKNDAELNIYLLEVKQQKKEIDIRLMTKRKEKKSIHRKLEKYEKYLNRCSQAKRLHEIKQQELEQEEVMQWRT